MPSERIGVLVVDDCPIILEAVCRLLESEADIEIVGLAQTGRDGWELARAAQPRVVLVDMNLPDRHGLDLLRQLRALLPQAHLLAMSALAGVGYEYAARAVGADRFFAKVDLVTGLVSAIRQGK